MKIFAALVVCALISCTPRPPTPVVNPPDAADAGPAQPPAPPVSCDTGCKHADTVCPGSGSPCGPACNRIGAVYARCVGAAAGCPDLKRCDPLAQ